MRILVTGASGLLGRSVLRHLIGKVECLGIAYGRYERYKSEFGESFVRCNLEDIEQVKNLFYLFKPTVVIHCAAERKPDVCEKNKEYTFKINVETTKSLSQLALEFGAYIITLSTDYVFDGRSPPYQVDSLTNPLSYYGQTKRESEIVTMESNPANLVLRVPVLYGQIESYSESAITVMVDQVLSSRDKAIEVDHWQIRYPTHVDDVARVLYQLVRAKEKASEQVFGIFHFSYNKEYTKYQMALILADILGTPPDNIKPNTQPSGSIRPHNAQLDISRTREVLATYLDSSLIHFSDFESNLKKSIIEFQKTQ